MTFRLSNIQLSKVKKYIYIYTALHKMGGLLVQMGQIIAQRSEQRLVIMVNIRIFIIL